MSELAATLRQARDVRDRESRIALYESLAALEQRAAMRGASSDILARMAESRFLAGILREAVSPVRYECVRGSRHLWTVAPDLRAPRDAVPV